MSGGLGGLDVTGVVSTREMPPELAAECRNCLQIQKLQRYQKTDHQVNNMMTDGRGFDLSIRKGGVSDFEHSYYLDESEVPDDLIDLLDKLMAFIIRKRRNSGEGDQ